MLTCFKMTDPNKDFIIKAAGCNLGLEISTENWDIDIEGLEELDEFLQNETYITLYAISENKKILFYSSLNNCESYTKAVIFYKTKQTTTFNEDNFLQHVQISSFNGSPLLALYQSLGSIYSPIIGEQRQTNNNIQRQIANLQADLRSLLLSNDDQQSESSLEPFKIVDSLVNEVQYWEDLSNFSKNRSTRSTAAAFQEFLRPLSTEFVVSDVLPLNDVENILENAHNTLDDLWRHEPPYPKDRIIRLMDLIGYELITCMNKNIAKYDIWKDNYNGVSQILSQCISVGERWLNSCKQLTEIFWPNYASNMWKEPPYQPNDLVKFVERLQDVLVTLTLHRQLTRLLTSEEQETLKSNEIFYPFKDLNITELGPFSSHLWLKAKKQFEYLLSPIEERVGVKLQQQLSRINANTRQLLYEFTRNAELINRPILRKILLSQRQRLLTSLFDYVKELQAECSSENAVFLINKDTPKVVAEVIILRQVEAKVAEVQKTSKKLLDDLPNYQNLEQIVVELSKDLKQQHTDLFESWANEISTLIKNETLSLKESDPVVQFSKNKLMKVNYSPRLVGLILEVRQFKALGYHIPSHINQTAMHAQKFMSQARTLEQIATFHNTIGDRMIICQRPMMLASALELSKLVQEEKVVSWGDIKSVEKYVNLLKTAVEKLSKENNLLAAYHYQICEKIQTLEDVDLIKEYTKWKEVARQIRDILQQVEDKGFMNMQTWKMEIDTKFCEILEKQYVKSLDTLHLYLPEIYTNIIYRNSHLEFSPDEAALKEKYQQQLRRFLDIPINFRGVFDDKNIFASILEKNDVNLNKIHKQTDDLFQQLQDVLKHWQSWLQLDPLDVSKLLLWQHWDLHFRASKTFGQEIAKLPNTEEKVGCFSIGLSRLRSDLESHNRNYWDQLVMSLKDSIAQDVVKLQNYIDPSTAALTRQPVTMEEIGESGALHVNVTKQAPEMTECFIQMMKKAQTLESWAREQVDSVKRVKGSWERLQSLLENHQHIIAKQMETIKTTLDVEKENLEREMERFSAKWEQIKSKPNFGQIAEQSIDELYKQLENIKQKKEQWNEILAKKDKLLLDFEKFNLEKPEFMYLEEIEKDINKEEGSWQLFEEFYSELDALSNEEWIVFRKKVYKFEDFLLGWNSKLKNMESTDLITRILQEISRLEEVMPTLKYVRGEDFTEKHWTDVFNILEMPSKPLDLLIFKDFLNVSDKLRANAETLQQLCKRASSEIVIRQALAELDQWDVQARFILTSHKDSKNTDLMLIKDFKDILNKIGDNQSLLQSVKNVANYDSFSERVVIWENKLTNLEQNLTMLALIQRKWIYLEPIFGSGTLIQEKSRFEKIDKDFHILLKSIEKDARISTLYRYPNLNNILSNLQEQLGRCQKSLENFLAEKRNKFPRFLFLGDDDLLEIVGQSSKEQVIQTHLKKLFGGINSIQMDESGKNIIAMCSLEGEVVPLSSPINVEQSVEDWLNVLVKQMQKTIKELLVQCLSDGQNVDPLKYPSQILCLSDNITFTLKVEQAIESMTLPPLLAYYKAQVSHYNSLELDNADSNILELKLKALLLDVIHHIDVIEELLEANVMKTSDWFWQKQLRFYSNSSGEVTIKMANARMEYAYEYLGNAPKLVRTILTDRCFLTLTQGMHLGMGGNPYGPAGTGKTESVKALGHLLGRQVLVFNCDEGIDATAMGRILTGLVQSGAWGCFDEFNRLDEATLSAVSMQIQPIQNALRMQHDTLMLLDQQVTMNRHCGVFVTLNPAGGNYGGRNKLPDNLKQLFRPVVMTHPDHEQIVKTLLRCDGYQNADLIGKKLIEVFDSSSKLLSKQQHYDWGLRAIRSALSGCGRNLKQFRKISNEPLTLSKELNLIVKVLRTDIMSKLTFADSFKFDGIIKNVFKDIDLVDTGDETLIQSLKEICQNSNYEINERQVNKCLELYEQLKQRMGVVIVGPPSSGKSTIRNLLFQALSKSGKLIKQHVFNPRSMQKTELLGQIDLDTRQWNDGVLTLYSLQVTSEPQDVWSWVVCDGNIDPEWVEALNSVLDDNRLLTLPSGWRIQFGPNVNFIFETHDLSYASPATISRMGIVLLDENDLKIDDYLSSYLRNEPEDSVVVDHINNYFLRAINWIIKEGEIVIPCSKLTLVKIGLSQLYSVKSKAEFIVGLVSGLGQLLQIDFREVFVQQIFDWAEEMPPPFILKCKYNRERDYIDSYSTSSHIDVEFDDKKIPLIFTGDVYQTLDRLKIWILPGNEQHFLLVGPHGSAKTLIIENLIKDRSDIEIANIHCNANLTPRHVLMKLSQYCITINTNKGRMYKPKKGYLLLHFKNLHLLKSDQWGTNILIEFLHQLITYKGFFDMNLEMVYIDHIIIVGSLVATNILSTRFTSIVNIYNINLPDQEDLATIIVSYLSAILQKKFVDKDKLIPKSKIVKLSSSILSTYDQMRSLFLITQYIHYAFSPHEITEWCASISRYEFETENIDTEIVEILCYEAIRQFGDKLVNADDRLKLMQILHETFFAPYNLTNFIDTWKNYFWIPTSQSYNPKLGRFNKKDWENMVLKGIQQYNREFEELNIIVSDEFLQLTASIYKVLSKPEGHVVLVGKSGIGRKSAVKLISMLHSVRLFRIISDIQPQFNNDLKLILQLTGLEDQEVYMLLEDQLLNKNAILNMINILISSGEIPSLYNTAEIDSMVAGLKDDALKENFEGDLQTFFIQRVKRRLHVITCLDINNENIWRVFENCPVLLYSSNIIWRSQWDYDTIKEMPDKIIERYVKNNSGEEVELCSKFPKIYDVIFDKSSAPSKYVAMINLYIKLYLEKKQQIVKEQNKLSAGVSKLTDARNLVSVLKQKATEQQQKLAEKQAKANDALNMISHTMQNANVHREQMESLKNKTEEENEILLARKKEIEAELAEVEPLIQEARSAVGNIKAEALSEIRSLRAPPEVIRDILEGVLRLMGIQDTSWNSMKTFLAKRGVKEEIRSFDASRISSENRQAVERLMANKQNSFDPKTAKRASVAAVPLAAWVIANVKYSHVHEKIKPLEREQYKLKENLQDAKSQLGKLSAGLSDVDEVVAKLKTQLSAYTKEAAEIEIDLNKAQETLAAAEGLVVKLEDEFQRWQVQLVDLSEQLRKLSDNCCLSAAFIIYLSQESEDERKKILQLWLEITEIDQFNFEEFLTSEREQMQWQTEGLPSDTLSTQNAVIILKTEITPLIIDPTSNAIQWIKTHWKKRQMEVVTQDSPKFATNVELAIRFGKILFIEEVEQISSCLLPILRQEFIQQGERKLINFRGKLIDYNINFKLILSSRNEQFKISSDVVAIVSVMNFTVTRAGLAEQLLSAAIRQENPELEDRRKHLLREREDLQEKQSQLQNQLLEDLANSSGDILQNAKLLKSLDETKTSSIAISKALEESALIQNKLQAECEAFEVISKFGSDLYFACMEFSQFNLLYSLSVPAFIKLYLEALHTFQSISASSYESQKKHLFEMVYTYVSRGIFKNDRIIFALHLLQKLYNIPQNEWNLFLNNSITGKVIQEKENLASWIPKSSQANVLNILNGLPSLYTDLKLDDEILWKKFMTTKSCEKEFPNHCKLSDFQKVLVVQALRPDRCYSVINQAVVNVTGLRSIDVLGVNLNQLYKESTAHESILLLTVSGSDPSNEIRSLANSLNIKCTEIAMGEGQEQKALKILHDISQTGQWLVLKNLHLVTNWLSTLCQNLQSLPKNDNFRVWLITEAHPQFNFVIAQNSLKLVYEAPQGIRNNLLRTYNVWGAQYLEKLNASSSKIFFVLSCIHAILQERRTYIPQGWSKWYEFGDTDLRACIKLVEDLWQTNSNQIAWRFILGLCYDAVYGGRIENLNDMDILRTYLKQYLTDEVLSHKWTPFGLKINLSNPNKFADCIKALKDIPERDSPSYFGLPENINRAWEQQTTRDIISKLKGFSISKQISQQFDKELWQKTLGPCIILWKKVNYGLDFIRMPLPEISFDESSISSFISEEYRNGVYLIQKIHKNFGTLNKICKGVCLPNDDDFYIAKELMNQVIPKSWKKIWDGPSDPQNYLRHLLLKVEKISQFSGDVNLAHLLHPDAFLTASKQEFSRLNNIPMDQLELESDWKVSNAQNGIKLRNLLIEGGIFDGHRIRPCSIDSENIISAPDCCIYWKQKKNTSDSRLFSVPLYYTASRDKQLTTLNIICEEKERDRWIQAGLAFYLEY